MSDLQLSSLLHSKAVQNKVEGILVSILGKRATERWSWWGMRMVRIWILERFSGRGSVVYPVRRQLALQLAANMTLNISVSL